MIALCSISRSFTIHPSLFTLHPSLFTLHPSLFTFHPFTFHFYITFAALSCNMQLKDLYQKALGFEWLTAEEGVFLFEKAPMAELAHIANELRKQQVPHGKVTWQIDRNVNTTNVCIANCKFCNFYRIPGHPEAYITSIDEYKRKIDETLKYGGDQLLLQGGHHPELGL